MFHNFSLKLLALGLAILFWVFVVSIENVFATLPYEIPAQPLNLRTDLALSSELPIVKITVRSESADIFRRLQSSDFEAYLDLSDTGAGTKEVFIRVTSKNPDVRVVRVQPNKALVTIEPIRETVLPLNVKITGKPAKDFDVMETRASIPSIRVKGAESVLRTYLAAEARIALDGKEEQSFEKPAKLVIKDASGNEVANVAVVDEQVLVFVKIEALKITKTVPVKVLFQGSLAHGTLAKVTSTPEVVEAQGPKEALDQISSIETEPVDLAIVQASGEKIVSLKIPEGIILVQPDDSKVKVFLEIVE